jgi:hypothetical protein
MEAISTPDTVISILLNEDGFLLLPQGVSFTIIPTRAGITMQSTDAARRASITVISFSVTFSLP